MAALQDTPRVPALTFGGLPTTLNSRDGALARGPRPGEGGGGHVAARRRGWKFWARVAAPVAASILGLCTLRLLGPDVLDQRELHAFLAPMGVWAPLVFVLMCGIRPVTLLPGQLFQAVGGMVFGTLMGTVYGLAGSFLSAVLVYGLGRRFGTRLMRRMAGHRYERLVGLAKRHDGKFGFLACINPLLPTDVMLATAASCRARFWPLVGGVMLGNLPGAFLTAQFGSGLAQGRTVMTLVSIAGLLVSLVAGAYFGRQIFQELNADDDEAPAEGLARGEARGTRVPAAALQPEAEPG